MPAGALPSTKKDGNDLAARDALAALSSIGSSARSSSAMRICTSRKREFTERNSSASVPRGDSAVLAA